jgi:calcineurin-like phosphoesterase family protein
MSNNLTHEQLNHTFLVSDTHFDHRNIIKYCHRPFKDIEGMNKALVQNWNDTVKPSDTVYCLGDICYGRGSRDPLIWLRHLNGQIILIQGSHDRHIPPHLMAPYEIIETDGFKFYLVHNLYDTPQEWDGWVIHGHNHHRRPFIDLKNKRVNVSVEVINYKPISLAYIIDLIKGLGMHNGRRLNNKRSEAPVRSLSSPLPK